MADPVPPSSTQEQLHALRVDYGKGALNESAVAADPIKQFARWFDDAKAANLPEPNAMTVATADATGMPSARILLLKDFDERGFTFFTNYGSRKARDLAANPRAALLFFWGPLERQVRVEGTVGLVNREESIAYFERRPRPAQIGAWASQQSQVIPSRDELEQRSREFDAKFGDAVPVPDHWGGYRLGPTMIEFWQGGASRLHDRLRYTRGDAGWKLERLAP